jgi:hypothetical protein
VDAQAFIERLSMLDAQILGQHLNEVEVTANRAYPKQRKRIGAPKQKFIDRNQRHDFDGRSLTEVRTEFRTL